MMRIAVAALAVLLGVGQQNKSSVGDLVQRLDSADWVEQAQAAKELARVGRPALEPLKAVMFSNSPSAKYWASLISEAILRGGEPASPAPVEPDPISVGNPKGFAPGPNDMGALVFICNNPAHDAYEATFSRCLTCAKTKRFAYDYGADCYRCAVCKKGYDRKDLRCDKCGQPPAGRIPVRMKSNGG